MHGAHFRSWTTLLWLIGCVGLLGCQTTQRLQEPTFNAYPVTADDRGALYRHELLAPEGSDRDDAVRLIQYCAARFAVERGFSSILFQDSAVVDRESGWNVPRYRVRVNARYAKTEVTPGAGAADIASRLRTELGASWSSIDSFCIQIKRDQ